MYPFSPSEPSAHILSHSVRFYNNAKDGHPEIIPTFPEEVNKKTTVA